MSDLKLTIKGKLEYIRIKLNDFEKKLDAGDVETLMVPSMPMAWMVDISNDLALLKQVDAIEKAGRNAIATIDKAFDRHGVPVGPGK